MTWRDWYDSLAKPSWTPEPSTIGLIWQILYPVILVTFGVRAGVPNGTSCQSLWAGRLCHHLQVKTVLPRVRPLPHRTESFPSLFQRQYSTDLRLDPGLSK